MYGRLGIFDPGFHFITAILIYIKLRKKSFCIFTTSETKQSSLDTSPVNFCSGQLFHHKKI